MGSIPAIPDARNVQLLLCQERFNEASAPAAILWCSKHQPTVALPSAGADFISASSIVHKVIFFLKFLTNLVFLRLSQVFADNVTCPAWSEGSVGGSDRAKHLRVHFVHEAREAGHLQLHKIDSQLNDADRPTKASTSLDVYGDLRRRVSGP
jgi:hypothetical protein